MNKSLNKNTIIFYATLLLIVFIPLYPKLPFLPVKGTYVAIRLDDVIIAVVVALWGIFNLNKLVQIAKKPIGQVFLLFWAIGVVTVLSGLFITHSISAHLGFLNWLRRIEMMILFFVAASSVKSVRQVKIFLLVTLLTTLTAVFYGFGQIFLGFPVISTTNNEFSKGLILKLTPGARVSSTFAGPYDLAMYLSFVIIFLGTMAFYYKKIIERILMGFTGVVSFVLLGYTAARLAYVGTLVGLIASFWLLGKRTLIILLVAVSILGAVGIPSIRNRLWASIKVELLGDVGQTYVAPSPSSHPLTKEQAATMSYELVEKEATKNATLSAKKGPGIPADVSPGEPTNYTELEVARSANIRLKVEWPRALRAFEKNPILGLGYSSLTDPTTKGEASDNDYLRALGETGLLGTLGLVLLFTMLVKKFWQFRSGSKGGFEKLFMIATLCSMLMLGMTAVFFDVLEASKIAVIFWILIGIAWAMVNGYEGV